MTDWEGRAQLYGGVWKVSQQADFVPYVVQRNISYVHDTAKTASLAIFPDLVWIAGFFRIYRGAAADQVEIYMQIYNFYWRHQIN